MFSPFENINDVIDSSDNKLKTLLKLAREGKDNPDEDCEDMTSPCCSSKLTTVFGSLPLKAKCTKCGKEYLLRELVNDML